MKRTLVLLALAALAAGCGGGDDSPSTADFKKDFAPLDAKLKAAGRQMAVVFQTSGEKTDAELTKEITAVESRLSAVNKDLHGVDASDEIKDDYTKLLGILDGLEKHLSSLATSVSSHDAARSKAGAEQIVRDSIKVKAVANRVRRAAGLKPTP